MYRPLQVGIISTEKSTVTYSENAAPASLERLMFYTWELWSHKTNSHFSYVVLPDACTDIIFDLNASTNSEKTIIMRSQKEAEQIPLGGNFHFAGIRLLPGTVPESTGILTHPSTLSTWDQLVLCRDRTERQQVLTGYVKQLSDTGLITENFIMHRILKEVSADTKVGDLEAITGYSSRQLQRLFQKELGFTPRDFLKIIRFQASLGQGPHWYADQSHLIKEYQRITGLTPNAFKQRF